MKMKEPLGTQVPSYAILSHKARGKATKSPFEDYELHVAVRFGRATAASVICCALPALIRVSPPELSCPEG